MSRNTLKRSQIPPHALVLYDWLQSRSETRYEIARRIGHTPSSSNQVISQYLKGQEIPPARLLSLRQQFPDFPLLEFITSSSRYRDNPHLALAAQVIRDVETEYVTMAQNFGLDISDRAYAIALEGKLAEDRADDPEIDDPDYSEICRQRRERNRAVFRNAIAKHAGSGVGA